jgi:hypothetical protein
MLKVQVVRITAISLLVGAFLVPSLLAPQAMERLGPGSYVVADGTAPPPTGPTPLPSKPSQS